MAGTDKVFHCDLAKPRCKTITSYAVFVFLNQNRVHFIDEDEDSDEDSTFDTFCDRVRHLETTEDGVVYLQFEPRHVDSVTGKRIPGKPFVWDPTEKLCIKSFLGEVRIFRMYYWDEKDEEDEELEYEGRFRKADRLELFTTLSEDDFFAHFHGRPRFVEAWDAYERRGRR